ncbi:cell division protein CrgA [Nakamurella antarctica]|uniref:Cell division protein CrgA n=1 Tax=Nakamurella antarctica TaxID=1902245 RepID=A0A3G8ZQU3_9ACTN|nr:cell division protein CrgA [Nakamurella antarctica]AZI56924.1 cell division protein CrgA [Nakamurella antarctica]
MPKSKVRKKTTGSGSTSSVSTSEAAALRAKVATPSGPVYMSVMLGLMLVGLIWLVVYYLWREHIPFMNSMGSWNFAIAFGLMVSGLLMTMRWR